MTLSTDLVAEISDYAHGRVPRALRERQILNLAEELFAEQGFTGASMDELARRAGVSKPVIYTLVGSKEQLYRRCVEGFSDELALRLAQAAESESEPADRLRAGIAAFFTFVDEHRRVWEALAWEVTPFAAEAAAVRRRQTELVAALLAASARRLGVEVDHLRVEATAHLLNGAVEALARWWGGHEDMSAEQMTDWAVALVLPGLDQLIDDGRSRRVAEDAK